MASILKANLNLAAIPKDKIYGVVYNIPCKNCDNNYIGETGRQMGTRMKEHREEVEKMTEGVSTRAGRKQSASIMHKSAITDHAVENNHIIDWDNVNIECKESNIYKRGVREAIIING